MLTMMQGGVCFLDYGPIQMTIDIECKRQKRTQLAERVAYDVIAEFEQTISHIDMIKSYRRQIVQQDNYSSVFKKLVAAVDRLGRSDFTLLAAIAGSFSEFALEKALDYGAERVIINNGGDIALSDVTGQPIVVAVPLQLTQANGAYVEIKVASNDGISGICASGLGGRSFTKGIASVAVVMAENASVADICATHIANQTNAESDKIVRAKAEEIDSQTDIKGHLVTLKVGAIDRKTKLTALLNGYNTLEKLQKEKIVKGGIVVVKDEIMMLPERIATLQIKSCFKNEQ